MMLCGSETVRESNSRKPKLSKGTWSMLTIRSGPSAPRWLFICSTQCRVCCIRCTSKQKAPCLREFSKQRLSSLSSASRQSYGFYENRVLLYISLEHLPLIQTNQLASRLLFSSSLSMKPGKLCKTTVRMWVSLPGFQSFPAAQSWV